MRKSFLTLMLTVVSSVWMANEAACLAQTPSDLQPSYITVSGRIELLAYPCEEGEECPACLTWAIVTSDKTYYLSTASQQVQEFLDHMETAPIPAIYPLPLQARASGTPYTQGNFDFLVVNNINDLYVQYFSDQLTRIPSLCDEWNVLGISDATGIGPEYESFRTTHYRLTKDSTIAYPNYYTFQRYTKIEQDGQYKGAIREGESGVIYYIPAGSAHEYLLYNFNAQVGDRLTNLWYGGDPERCPNGYNATVLSISDETPRVFTIEVEYIISDSDGDHIEPWLIYWTEGVGLSDGPVGHHCPGPDCACSCGQVLLCAYKNGEQIYVSELGEQYGCVYNYDPFAPVDTIPMFARDNSGSSTVDPVDPNQVVVTLKGDELTIREFSNVEVTYTLRHNEQAKMPSSHRAPQSDTFRNEVTIQITQSGEYLLQLTNPSWGYTIFGEFDYLPQGIETVHSTSVPQKVLQNGQLYILRGKKIYIITGQRVK